MKLLRRHEHWRTTLVLMRVWLGRPRKLPVQIMPNSREGTSVEQDVVWLSVIMDEGRGMAMQIAQALSYLQENGYLLVKWNGLAWVLDEVVSKTDVHALHHNVHDRGAVRGIPIQPPEGHHVGVLNFDHARHSFSY